MEDSHFAWYRSSHVCFLCCSCDNSRRESQHFSSHEDMDSLPGDFGFAVHELRRPEVRRGWYGRTEVRF